MNIIGLDALVFGVDDIQACSDFLRDYGLQPVDVDSRGGRFEALDGTAVIIRSADDASLPAAIGPAPSIRETVYGVVCAADLDAIADELGRDRPVTRDANGVLIADEVLAKHDENYMPPEVMQALEQSGMKQQHDAANAAKQASPAEYAQ